MFAYIDRMGIWFLMWGDEICWTWPWQRIVQRRRYDVSYRWVSLSLGSFRHVEDIRHEWDCYHFAERYNGERPEDYPSYYPLASRWMRLLDRL